MAKCQLKPFKQMQVFAQTPTQALAQSLMGARRPEAAEKCPTRDASPPLERKALAQQFFSWLQIRFLICQSDNASSR